MQACEKSMCARACRITLGLMLCGGLVFAICWFTMSTRSSKAEDTTPNVIVTAKAGNGGRLFGAVTTSEIADAVKAAGAPAVDKRKVEVGQPIKALGNYTVQVRLHPEVTAAISITVVAAV